MKGKLRKNIPTLVILIIAGEMIYTLPYFRNYYYDVFLNAFHLTNTQMGTLGSAYGVCCLISYIFGGYVADRWRTKHLLSISLFATGILGFALLLYPPYPVLLLIYAAWGITSIMTFWVALIKAVRSLASENEQGKAFGFFEGGRGAAKVIESALVLGLFAILAKQLSDKLALSSVIIFYSVMCILLGFMIMLLYKEPDGNNSSGEIKEKEDKKFDWAILLRILKMPTTWLAAILILTSYAMINSFYYITPYATAAFGASTIIAAALGYFSQYCRPIGSFGSGIIGDRIGISNMVIIGYCVLAIGLAALIVLPGKPSFILLLLVFIAIIYISMYALQATHFAILVEGDYPVETTGTVAMPLMIIGYSGEIFMPIVAGACLDHWSGTDGYKVLFTILLGLTIVGLITAIIWQRVTKEKRKEISLLKREMKAS
ncbi:MFS transporter [Peribacillus frigoritolerans]|jgi:MFS family permease|uniref:MFS transporter n=1 Tax=Peribacillus frigoritolerans TaxID=450367 RepID=UPI00227FF12A|nr:MFS transporter [Peribacillus frigoritolerans]MCY9002742.1 MFS transporter [Peribacillus frigoritolerans]MED3996121.1 MFS transporter [Peribacillus frigoritolerans]